MPLRTVLASVMVLGAMSAFAADPVTIGPYKYDVAGNVVHLGADRYTYDGLSRITTGTALTPQNPDRQEFEYDGFGNLRRSPYLPRAVCTSTSIRPRTA